jgi:cytochrome c biogenesis protein CcmG, thiol:disulfide interchange protein DsbE
MTLRIALFLMLTLAACSVAPGQPAGVGAPAPATELTLLDGHRVTLEQFAGQPVLLNFWATWCVPCRAELPALAGIADANAELAVFAINMQEDAKLAAAFLNRISVELPAAVDHDGAIARAYGVANLPTSILIGPDGTVIARHIGYLDEAGITAFLTPVLR